MLNWFWSIFRRSPVPFDAARLANGFCRAAAARGLPRGLVWKSCEPAGEPRMVLDADGTPTALAPLIVHFEPEPGSEMESNPMARLPRPVVAIFHWKRGAWRPAPPAIFNLSVEQVLEQSKGRFR